jgi:hypothetical protein
MTMSSQSEQLKERTMQFSLGVLRLIDGFPRSIAADVVARQLENCAQCSGGHSEPRELMREQQINQSTNQMTQ